MSIAYSVWNERAGQAAQPSPVRCADYAFVHSLIDERDKVRSAAIRACVQGRANVAQDKTLRAGHAPTGAGVKLFFTENRGAGAAMAADAIEQMDLEI